MTDSKERSYEILVYGIEDKGLSAPTDPIVGRNFSIYFEPLDTSRRFNEFDGVVLYKGVFEHFAWKGSIHKHLTHSCYQDELDKRKKEAKLLEEKGGFLCFLLDDEFIDNGDFGNIKRSDLAKYHLNYQDFYRENFGTRIAHLKILSDDFRPFLKIYGAATSHFHHYNNHIDWRVLTEVAGKCVGMIIDRNNYFLPTLIPDNRPEVIEEYFTLLVKGLTSSYNKLQISIPDWIEKFPFEEETPLNDERRSIEARLLEISERKNKLNLFKSILALTGDDLATRVSRIFIDGFGIAVDTKDELREDFKLLDGSSKPVCLCEVKGTNKGVKREYINQADSHRERSGFSASFPALLIVNTHIKNARSISEKDQEIAGEQILHAVKMNVLVLRTIDLLGLLRIFLNGNLEVEDLLQLLTENCGWLRISDQGYSVITEAISTE